MQRIGLSLIALVLFASSAFSQFDTATVLGTIQDPAGAVVPQCAVTLENLETGISVEASTDAVGNFEFFNVKIGSYQVSVEQTGFKRALSNAFTVTVNARQRVDLTLEVGAVTETVEVTGAAALLEMDTSSRGTVVGHRQIVDLPLNGRSYADLALLVPGTNQALRGSVSGRNASYHVNGLRSSFNNFTLDGLDNNNYGTSNQGFSSQVVQLAPDAVGEFKVTTNNFSAEYGRAGGAVINASLKSGTNDYHVTLWEFVRNTNLNAVGFFKPQFGKPTLVQNQFGAAGGGPIVRNKAFFFADWEGLRRIQKRLVFADIPTLEHREGRLGRPAADPYTRTPYPNGDVPQSVMTPFSRRVLSDLPAPNRPGLGDNFESLPGDDTDDKKGDVKIDHYFSERATAFFRFSHRKFNRFYPDEIPGPSGGDSNQNVGAFNQSFAGGVTYTLNPSSLLEFRLAFIRSEGGKTPVNFDGPHVEDEYGITGVAKDERIGGGLNSHEVSGFNDFGRQTSNPQFQDPDNWNPRLNYSTTKGNHSFKLGYEHQRIDTDINDLSPVYGRSRYAGRFSTPPGESSNNIHNLGDFFVGAQSTIEMSRFVVLEYRQRMHFFYVQDDWKVSPNLTLNLGARYEYASPQWENRNRLGNFDPNTNSLVFAGDGSISDRALVDPDRNNWAPRVGLAYRLNPKTVIRSGYGVSYIHFNRMGGENILGFTGPFVFRRTQNQAPPSSLPLCSPGQPGQNLSTCFTRTQYGFTPDFLADETYDTSISRVNFQPRDTRSGYVQSWHFTMQRELARDLALDVAYVGNRGAKQLILTDFNQARPNGPDENLSIDDRRPIPGFTHIQMSFSGGNTFYHAFQAKLEKRFSRGLYVLNSFTWSKAIDNAAGHLETFNGDRSRINFLDQKSERGLSSYDIPVNNVTSLIWEIPFGSGRRYGSGLGGVANAVLGGWRTTVINNARSGNTINIYYNPASQARVCGACRTRPNVVGPFQNPDQDPHDYFIGDNIVIPPFTAPFGNMGRNTGRTPGFAQLDFGLHKDFALPREGSKVEFRAEFFNLFNRTNFRAPQGRRDSSSFGRITSTFPAREVQLAVKLYF